MARTKETARKQTGEKRDFRTGIAFKSTPGHSRKQSKPQRLNRSVAVAKATARRRRPGELALKEIRQYQSGGKNAYKLLIPRLPFWRYAREILINLRGPGEDFRWSVAGVTALQEAAEAYLVGFFDDAYACTIHAKRVTLMAKDMALAKRIRREGMKDHMPPGII